MRSTLQLNTIEQFSVGPCARIDQLLLTQSSQFFRKLAVFDLP
jgi:hypothetical protein